MISLKNLSIVNPIPSMKPFGNHFNKQYASIEILKKINAQNQIENIASIKSRINTLSNIYSILQLNNLSGAVNA